MMEGAAPSPDQPSSTPVVAPGKGFTKTCKGGVVVLIGGYALLQLIPGSVSYLAIIPAKTISFVWTLFTAGYIEQVLPEAIGSSLGLLFCGKDVEPVWGHKELLKFIILVNFITSILAFVIAVTLYYITCKESFLTTPLSGFHGVLAGFLVALKQILPNLELPMCFFWKIKAKKKKMKMALALLTISALLLVNPVRCTDENDDIAFLAQDDVDEVHSHLPQFNHEEDLSKANSDLPSQFNPEENEDEDDMANFDESHVVVLTDANFSSLITKNKHVMVEFYAPWCGHCKTLAPEYAAAAKDLAEEGAEVALAKVDATEESDLSQKYDIQGFPTVLFFIDGVRLDYSGGRSRDTIVEWIKKKIGPGVHNITTVEEAELILTSQDKIVLGYLHSLVGADSDELSAASKLEDQVIFYQTVNADVAKLFHIDPKAKRPALVLLKKEEEKLTYFDGELSTSRMAEFVAANKLPLVTTFTQESAQSLFDNAIKKQVLLFTLSNETSDVLPVFQEAAKSFKGKIIFVSVEKDNEEIGEPVCAYFGVTGEGPQVIAFSGNEDQKKYFLKGELTVDNIKKFAEDFLEDRLQPFFKSDPIPKTNDGDVKIVVGNNFDEIVLDESKDVLLEIYAPWCGHCEALEPIYNKLGKHLRGIDSLVVAKMDGTSNEHPRAQQDGFPTILFFPAGNKSFEPIVYDGERTVVEFYKFLKKHASIPFKLKKQHATPSVTKSESTTEASATESKKADNDWKDEL